MGMKDDGGTITRQGGEWKILGVGRQKAKTLTTRGNEIADVENVGGPVWDWGQKKKTKKEGGQQRMFCYCDRRGCPRKMKKKQRGERLEGGTGSIGPVGPRV